MPGTAQTNYAFCYGDASRLVGANWEGATAMEDAIVQPASLTRDLSEAICQQCHLQGDVKVHPYGRDDWSFRPGQPLNQTRVDYRLEADESAMSLLGHVEQMHQSVCYQGSDRFTCTSLDTHFSSGNLT